ncbi:inositol phosphorylceramide synthase [Kitasatospora sp. NA04385]|uniref:phosphatase PAP2 family protein n=1 Tax=Kitasatospora sp. NA04385 TaxID=2742135 RepID=UPI001591329D|nr:phosphatase PAP2 family protein [Kitasatospora sp. NA04385]QKW23470.1 inositol phosphorylceramide synthase [Kitasatospora sp. NA04385]
MIDSSHLAARSRSLALHLLSRLKLRHLAWPLFVLAFWYYLSVYGLPYANDVVFLWLMAALIAASVHSGGRRGWLYVLRDWIPVMAVVWVYSLLRGYGAHTPWPPHYAPQIAFDEVLGFGETWTVRLQDWLYHPGNPQWYDYAAVTVYMSHFFAVFVILAVLWKRDHARFRHFLGCYLAMTAIGFATYVLYPADPPWLAGLEHHMPTVDRVVNTVLNDSGLPRAGTIFENGSKFANDVAAMPSLHAAYPMVIALFFWPLAGRKLRVLLAAYPLAMAFTLVYGAEHFIIDILVGWAFAWAMVALVNRIVARRAAARAVKEAAVEPAVEPTVPVG